MDLEFVKHDITIEGLDLEYVIAYKLIRSLSSV